MLDELKKYCDDIPVILFANKVDLVNENDVNENDLNEIELQNLVKDYNFLGYYITSAKTEQGVIEAFNAIIEKLYYKYKKLSTQV